MVSFVVQCVGQRTGLVPRGICGTILKANLPPNLSSERGQFPNAKQINADSGAAAVEADSRRLGIH